MLLTITSTTPPAADLGYLLHKNPARTQSFDLTFGKAHVFWPEVGDDRATAALLLEVDPIGLSRGRRDENRPLEPYVNDRPYVASSFLAVAIGEVYGSALSGKSRERQARADAVEAYEIAISVLPCRGGEGLLRKLFEPLGYAVEAEGMPLDPVHPEWGPSRYYRVRLRVTARLADVLAHLTVLVPVLDDEKHYYVGDDEVEKLIRRGGAWLAGHPEKDLVARRYLKHRPSLARAALQRIVGAEDLSGGDVQEGAAEEGALERPLDLAGQRHAAVVERLAAAGAKRVLDLGCGEGQLLRALLADRRFTEIVGVDVSARALEIAQRRLHLDDTPNPRIRLLHGSLTYRDARITGYDAAAVVEVIEHMEPDRLDAFARVLFGHTRPKTVIVTTPNAEYNVLFENLAAGRFRHGDHRFEWTRAEFQAWATAAAEAHGYTVTFGSIGDEHPELGAPTQLAELRR